MRPRINKLQSTHSWRKRNFVAATKRNSERKLGRICADQSSTLGATTQFAFARNQNVRRKCTHATIALAAAYRVRKVTRARSAATSESGARSRSAIVGSNSSCCQLALAQCNLIQLSLACSFQFAVWLARKQRVAARLARRKQLRESLRARDQQSKQTAKVRSKQRTTERMKESQTKRREE